MSSTKTAAFVIGGLLAGAAIAHARSKRAEGRSGQWLEEGWDGGPPYARMQPDGKFALPATYVGCEGAGRARLPDKDCAWIAERYGAGSGQVSIPLTKRILMGLAGRFVL